MFRTFIAVVLALVLAGCSSDAETAASPAVSSSAPAVAISDDQYLQLVRAQSWVTPNMKDATLFGAGSTSCAVITESPADAQFTGWKRAIDGATANGLMSQREAGEFLVYASARFCPEARGAYFPKS